MKAPQIILNSIRTPDSTVLVSYHRWDYVSHKDTITGETYFTDGGNDYIRRSVNNTPYVDLTVTTDDPFEKQRESFHWKGHGKNNEYAPSGHWYLLKDMTDLHINNILCTQIHILGTYVEDLFVKELKYRKQSQISIKD